MMPKAYKLIVVFLIVLQCSFIPGCSEDDDSSSPVSPKTGILPLRIYYPLKGSESFAYAQSGDPVVRGWIEDKYYYAGVQKEAIKDKDLYGPNVQWLSNSFKNPSVNEFNVRNTKRVDGPCFFGRAVNNSTVFVFYYKIYETWSPSEDPKTVKKILALGMTHEIYHVLESGKLGEHEKGSEWNIMTDKIDYILKRLRSNQPVFFDERQCDIIRKTLGGYAKPVFPPRYNTPK